MRQELSGHTRIVRVCQELQGFARGCHELTAFVRHCQECQVEPGVISARVVRSWSVLEKMQLSLSLS